MPEKTWESKTVGEPKELASRLGDHNADWVEQALEWAQRIANGETWEAVCNEDDTANWHRLIVWKGFSCHIVGGSRFCPYKYPASNLYGAYYGYYVTYDTVPLVVAYE